MLVALAGLRQFVGTQLMEAFFPFTIWHRDFGNTAVSPHQYKAIYEQRRPANMSWFAYSVIVLSPTKIEFIVYEMEDHYHGGVGQQVARLPTVVPAEATFLDRKDRAEELARDQRRKELQEAEERIVRGYAEQILDSQGMIESPVQEES